LPYEKVGNEVRCIADEVPFDIPDGWEWARLKNLVYNNGQIKPKTDFCYIDIGSIDNLNQKLNDLEKIVSADKAPSRARKIVKLGDILYSTVRPYLHNMCIIDRNFSHIPIASTGFAVLTTFRNFFNKFLFYYLLSPDFDSYANNVENSKGVAYPAINDERLYKSLIPIPPFEEQKKIVAKIEEILPYIRKYDKTEKQLTALNTNFPEQLKKSILQQAIQGKLVPQNPDDEPASVLLEKIREEKQKLIKEGKIKKDKNESIIFKRDKSHYERIGNTERCIDDEIPFEIPDNWAWCRLGSILYKLSDGTHSTPHYTTQGIPFISVKDLSSGVLNFSNCKYISNEEHKILYTRCNPEFGDILLTKVGTTGIPVIVNTEKEFSLFVSVALLKFNQALISNVYLKYLINSPLVQEQAKKNTRGVGNKNWVMRDIANTLIVLPPVAEQSRIVAKINEIMRFINNL
jgi:type I restriction enzyme S subunit